ncbi:MAG: DUF1841 family protein [Betaproteobacteria bacterium]|jgi:hypothetical protein|nr:DUF1841 family protein [Betaproteobacteria bacterium]
MLFEPTRDEVRGFFIEAWRKARAPEPLTPLESIAIEWIGLHPEYHGLLESPDVARAADFSVELGQTNPFLHLSMHLSLSEQESIDQPPGIRAALQRLSQRLDDRHEAMHAAMECLGEVLHTAQRSHSTPDTQAYLDCLLRRASALD